MPRTSVRSGASPISSRIKRRLSSRVVTRAHANALGVPGRRRVLVARTVRARLLAVLLERVRQAGLHEDLALLRGEAVRDHELAVAVVDLDRELVRVVL